ncbi:MAG: FecR domain-containing protein [Ignavibacteriales bacterium]|nr:FecR domain-containing protein [Ignavibacteriales bacterium]
MTKHSNDIPWDKLARYFFGDCSREEKAEMDGWLDANPDLRQYLNALNETRGQARLKRPDWDLQMERAKLAMRTKTDLEPFAPSLRSVAQGKPGTFAPEAHPRQPQGKLLKGGLEPTVENLEHLGRRTLARRSSIRQFARIAAIVVALIGIPYIIFNYENIFSPAPTQHVLAMREVATERGQRVRLKFADGTKVTLNAASSVRFPEKFGNGSREIRLQGEAYFDVSRMENSPFVVHAGDAKVQVLGTGFNVKAWPDEDRVEVVLARGKVAVRSDKKPDSGEVVLAPGQRSVVHEGEIPTAPQAVDLEKHLAWIEGGLVFDKTPVVQVVKELERRYDIDIMLSDSALFSDYLSATFTRNQSLNDVFKALSIAMNVDVKQDGRTVSLVPRKTPKAR